MARTTRPKIPARTTPAAREARPPKPAGATTRKSLSLVRIDGSKLRSAADRKLQQLRTEHTKLQQDITHFREVESREYMRWICQHFGPIRTSIIETFEKIRYNSLILDEVDFLGFAYGMEPGEAYQRILDELAGKGPAEPGTESDDSDRRDATGNDRDSAGAGRSKRKRDPFEDFLNDVFGPKDDDDDPRDDDDFFGGKSAASDSPPHLASRLDEIRQVYRAIVKRLHPDSSGPMSQPQESLWHTAQAAYQSGNLEHLQSILAELGGDHQGPLLEPTVDSILQQQRELRRQNRELRTSIEELKTDPAWGFLKKKDDALRRGIFRKRLEKDLQDAMSQLRELELDIEEIKEEHAVWKSTQELRRRQPVRARPRKRPRNS